MNNHRYIVPCVRGGLSEYDDPKLHLVFEWEFGEQYHESLAQGEYLTCIEAFERLGSPGDFLHVTQKAYGLGQLEEDYFVVTGKNGDVQGIGIAQIHQVFRDPPPPSE